MPAPSYWRFTMPGEMVAGPPYNLSRPVFQVLTGLGVLLFVGVAVLSLAQGGVTIAAALLLLAVGGVAAAYAPVWARWATPSRAEDLETRDGATVAPYYASTVRATAVFHAAVAAGLAWVAVAALVLGWSPWTLLVLLPLAVFVAHLVNLATGRVGRGGLELRPEAVTHHGWSFATSIPWSAAAPPTEVIGRDFGVVTTDEAAVTTTERTTWWRFDAPDRLAGHAALLLRGDRSRFDPALLRALVAFYHAHPDLRRELGTPAAIQRARSLDAVGWAGPSAR